MELTVFVGRQATTLARNSFGNFDEEASTLGLPPGVWPATLEALVDDTREWLLRGTVEVNMVTYSSRDGLVRLLVWND